VFSVFSETSKANSQMSAEPDKRFCGQWPNYKHEREGVPGQLSLEGRYDVFHDVIVCKNCFPWFSTFSFAFSGSRL